MRHPNRNTTALAVVAAAFFMSCRGDRHVEVLELASQPAKSAATAPAAPAPKVALAEPSTPKPRAKAKPPWSSEPVHEGLELRMERVGPHLLRITGENVALSLKIPKLGECVEAPTQLETPELMPEVDVDERPAWLALIGEHEAAAIRLSTRGALLVINDGCQRAGDITPALLGTLATSTDPVFAADEVAPDESYDADDIRMRRLGGTKAAILVDNKPYLDVSFFNGESTLTARALDDERWIRLLMTREWEYTQNDGAVGREHTLVWAPRPGEQPLLVMDNDYRYGMDGFAREEADVVSTRTQPHAEGLVSATGTRSLDYFQNAGRDLCPEAKQAFAFKNYDESVSWTYQPSDSKKAVKLGTARTHATFAGGCLNIAKKELKRRRTRLTKRAPDAKVRWTAH